MKRSKIFLCVLVVLFGLTACQNNKKDPGVDLIRNPRSAQGYNEKEAMPVITFDTDVHDFGRLSAGESVSYSFHFRNTGKADLIINSCSATCGCTIADYPKERIAPGGDGYVTVSFNSAGKSGQQFQEVTVVSNAQPSSVKLTILAQVTR